MAQLLVTATDVASHPEWRVFDCRHDLSNTAAGLTAYANGHLPGAVHLHLDHDLSGPMTGTNGRHPLPDRETFAAHIADLGVGEDTQVVAYDSQGGVYASRLLWLLRWIGHHNVAVLDGGIAAWQKEGFDLVTTAPTFASCSSRTLEPARGLTVDAAAILHSIASKEFLVIDARSAERFAGRNETLDPVAGHIPGANNRFFQNNLVAETGCFKAPDVLRAEFTALLAGTNANEVVHQCGSGVTACHNLLAMEIAGIEGSRLYPGSWSEWCSDPARPVVTADASTP